jgi:hypothetical protein
MSNRALLLVCGVLAAAGCADIVGDAPQPVSVDVGFWGSVLEVGTPSRVCAFGMAAWGLAVATHPVEVWTLSDPSLAKIEQTPDPFDRPACILLRPLRAGTLTVTARMAGVNGMGTVRLIPTIQTIRITPSALTLRVGDSSSVMATFIAVNGDTIRDIPIIWRVSDNGTVSNVVLYGTGPTDSAIVSANSVGENSVTAEAATPRQDSANNTRGHAQVTVRASGGL